MSTSDASADPQRLREEIEQTRADLGDTVQALAAKTDVKARATQAAGEAADRVRDRLSEGKEQVVRATGAAKDRLSESSQTVAARTAPARQRLVTVKEQVGEASRRPAVRQAITPVTLAAVAAALIGVVILVVRRRR